MEKSKREHELKIEFVRVGESPTWFKRETKPSDYLLPEDKCLIKQNTLLEITEPGVYENKHIKVTLSPKEDLGCDYPTGYFYAGHLESATVNYESLLKNQSNVYSLEFMRVIKHILHLEGGCSDNKHDPGGRTFMGITAQRAKTSGWYGDVCEMPKELVCSIYKHDYFMQRAFRYPWPLNLAVMNTEVHSGGGRAQQFIRRMIEENITGTYKQKAIWFLKQQYAFYEYLYQKNPKYKKFRNGWDNRCIYLEKIINESK